jgi:predicted DNA-binding transcriptional regulator AlpA
MMKPLIARPTAEELSHRAHFFPLPLRPVNLRVQFDRTCPSQTYVRRRSNADKPCVGIFAALFVPLADTTIYEMERRGEFPRRFNLTPRCVVWNLTEVEAWIEHQFDIRLVGNRME